ncbi:MAG: GNAT family N-acetyltransferase [Bacillota bacterium]|jgi:ribosomal protein S18 acetylase RimI-like enzyme
MDPCHIQPETQALGELRPEDIPQVLDLWSRSGPGVGLGRGDDPAGLAAFLERNPGTSFVARAGGRVIGAVLGAWDGRRGYLHHLAVDPAWRRRGLGTALTRRALEALREVGAGKVHIFVHVENVEAVEFYERLGWYRRETLAMMSFDL